MTNEHTHTHNHIHHRHSADQKDTVLCVCVGQKVVSIDLSLMKITLCAHPVTIHRTHKHAIILRLCNLCGSILYIRKHKIAAAREETECISQLASTISLSFGSQPFSQLYGLHFRCQYFCSVSGLWYCRSNRKNRLTIAFLFAWLYRIVFVYKSMYACMYSEAKCSTNIYWTWFSSFCHQNKCWITHNLWLVLSVDI